MSEQADRLKQAWEQEISHIQENLRTNLEKGLSKEEARKRLDKYGRNELRQAEKKSAWVIFADQFRSILVLLLTVAAGVSFIFGDNIEGIAIAAVILINALIGFFTELKAVRSMEALQDLSRVDATVIRAGNPQTISAEKVVPGDILKLSAGSIITADCRLFEVSKLQTDEAALTGESVPVGKQTDPIEADTPLAERVNMAYKGTSVTRGEGLGIVVFTGMDTELGQISSLVEQAEDEATPLEERLDQLGQKLVWATLGIAVVVGAAGFIAGKEIVLMIETAIALAVATVPEGLPIVATIALARGMRRMAKRNALINHLSAVETLGATNVICTDKTGTLTENQMTVVEIQTSGKTFEISGEGLQLEGEFRSNDQRVDPREEAALSKLLRTIVLCNNATITKDNSAEPVGEPLEVALLIAGEKADLTRSDLLNELPELREEAFDPEVRMMATVNRQNEQTLVNVKGAPEAVLEISNRIETQDGPLELDIETKETWHKKNNQMAKDGLRVIAVGYKQTKSEEDDPYSNLVFLGLLGLLDPPRENVSDAIQACQRAGIKVVMVTGDQPDTAKKVGQAVGMTQVADPEIIRGRKLKSQTDEDSHEALIGAPIIARVSPKQKIDLITSYQEEDYIVAMTGDGVNDAPALKKADIGIAMGQRGTQVAKEAADMVLQDDAFSTIVEAIRQGRAIFDNIRKFVLYLLSCNVSEIAVISIASVINTPLPIKPLQILFLNLVTDVFPALALGVSEGDPQIMQRKPRKRAEPIMRRNDWLSVVSYSMLITMSVLTAFGLSFSWLEKDTATAVTISFLTLAFAQLWHVFNMRSHQSHPIKNEVVQNLYVWGALLLCILLLLAAIYIPGLANILQVTDPGLDGWALLLGMSLIPLLVGQILKQIEVPFLNLSNQNN